VREALLDRLRCPACGTDRSLALHGAGVRDEREIREGELRCRSCERTFAIRAGVAELLHDPPEYVVREAAGLERFAAVMRADGWDREMVRALPYVDIPYWWGQRRAFEYWCDELPLREGDWLLDVGSATCWAGAQFAARGLNVIALDISTAELQGLRTADHFIEDGAVYFERVLSDMSQPAIASGSLDYIFCCESLHHNRPAELRRTLREFNRMLRPGGSLILANEPLRFPLKLKRDHGAEVAQFEGNENVYFLHEYVLAAARAGFAVSVRWPRNAPKSSRDEEQPRRPTPGMLRRSLRRLRAAVRLAVSGDASLNMLCRKRG